MRLRELAQRLDCRLEGDGDIDVQRIESLGSAGRGDLSFFVNPRYVDALRHTQASGVILGDEAPPAPCAMLRSSHPYVAFAEAVGLFAPPLTEWRGVHDTAVLGPGVVLGADVCVGPFVSIGAGTVVGAGTIIDAHVAIGPDVTIGDGCRIHSQVAIRERVVLGRRVIVQNGAVIGSDGYGFARRPDGTHHKIPQVGRVVIEDDVEIGANAAIDRPALGETRVGAGTKIDNLVQVGHGVTVGRNVLLAGQVGIAGSTTIEDDVVLAGQVGVAGHITIGKGVRATAQTGIPNSVEAGAFISGYPAIANRDWLKSSVVFRQLPAVKKAITALERRLTTLAPSPSPDEDA